MAKRLFVLPRIFASEVIATDTEGLIGGGSGQATPDPFPIDFEEWSILYMDLNLDGNEVPGEFTDYVCWWYDMGYNKNPAYNELFFNWNGKPLPEDPSPNP